jgi:hypothetical protein
MTWLALLNPLNWIKILGLINSILGFVKSAATFVAAAWRNRKQANEIEEIKQVEEQIQNANQIEDTETRLKEKADAARKLEEALNPRRKQ